MPLGMRRVVTKDGHDNGGIDAAGAGIRRPSSDRVGLVDDGRDRQCDLLFAGVAFALGGIAAKARGFYTCRAAQASRAKGRYLTFFVAARG